MLHASRFQVSLNRSCTISYNPPFTISCAARRQYGATLAALVELTERCGAEAYRVSRSEGGIYLNESWDDTPSSEGIDPAAAPEMGPVTMLVAVSQRVNIDSKIKVSIECVFLMSSSAVH